MRTLKDAAYDPLVKRPATQPRTGTPGRDAVRILSILLSFTIGVAIGFLTRRFFRFL